MGEVPADTVTLGVGRLANTLGRVGGWPRSVAVAALKVARTLNTAEGDTVGRVMALLLVFLGLDKVGEVVAGTIHAKMVDHIPRHGVAVEEAREDRQAETKGDVSSKNVDTSGSNVNIHVESDTDIEEIFLHMSLPCPDNIPVHRKDGRARKKERKEGRQRR